MPTNPRFAGKNHSQIPELVSDGIALKGLPQTPGYPVGYGDLASAINKIDDENTDQVKTVVPLGHASFKMDSEYNGVLYGVLSQADNFISKMTTDGVISSFGNPLPAANISCIKFINDSRLLVEAEVSTGLFQLFLSADSGQTWQMVYDNQIQFVKTLTDRSICVADIGGSTVILYGQYNVNGSRTPGGTNDAVKLLRSNDLGQTWSVVTEWNTDGATRNIRHIHCVKQDHVSKRIYVATGDSNSESCIYSWDGVSAWPINVSPENTVQTAGLKSKSGAQRFRAVDILFRGDNMYWMPDTNSGSSNYASEVGVWSVDTGFATEPKKISSAGSHLAGNAGWLNVETSDGTVYWCTGVDASEAGFVHSAIIASNRDLTQWKAVGAFRGVAGSNPIPVGFAVVNDVVYHCATEGSGKGEHNTVWFRASEFDFRGDLSTVYELDTIHPVYWVDPINGSNSNNGWSPNNAFASVDYAVTGDRVTYGARVQLPLGEYNYTGASINPKFNANARGGDTSETCYVYGYGASKTSFVFDSTATAGTGFLLNTTANAPRFGVKSMTCYSEKNMRLLDLFGAACNFYVSQSIFGATQFANPVLARGEAGSIYNYSSVILGSSTIYTTATSGSGRFQYYGDKVAMYGGGDQFKLTTTATTHVLRAIDIDFNGFSGNAIDTTAGDFSDFYIKRGVFVSTISGAIAMTGPSTAWNGRLFNCKSAVPIGVAAAVFGDLEPCTNSITGSFSEYVD